MTLSLFRSLWHLTQYRWSNSFCCCARDPAGAAGFAAGFAPDDCWGA